MNKTRRGLLIILSSPSGAGKSTLSRMLLDWDPSLRFSVSATTRDPRSGEIDGREYYFKTRDEFEKLIASDGMLEHAKVFDNFYGSPKEPIESAVSKGIDIVFDVDWQGGQQIRASSMKNDVISIFILPPSITELERRLNARGQDSIEVVASRMSKSKDEISHWNEYEYLIVNNDLQQSFEALKSILIAERTKQVRRNDLEFLIGNLNTEFDAVS